MLQSQYSQNAGIMALSDAQDSCGGPVLHKGQVIYLARHSPEVVCNSSENKLRVHG